MFPALQTDLYNTRQVRIALDRDMDRVQRVFVAEGECCDLEFLRRQHPDLIIVRATPDAAPILELLRRLARAMTSGEAVASISSIPSATS